MIVMMLTRKEILSWPEGTARLDKERIDSQEPPEDVLIDSDHWYVKDRIPHHSFMIVTPKYGTIKPGLVIEIHGGAWIYGDKELNAHHSMYLASTGRKVVSLSYRLLSETDMKGMIQDIIAFYVHIWTHRDALDLDFSKVLVTGDSAGAHLAALSYAVLNDPELQRIYGIEKLPGFRITMLGLSHPVMNVDDLHALDRVHMDAGTLNEEFRKMMTGSETPEDTEIDSCISFKDVIGRVEWPEMYIITSGADPWRYNTLVSISALDRLGIPYTKKDWPCREDMGHVFHIGFWDKKESIESNDSMLDHFDTL